MMDPFFSVMDILFPFIFITFFLVFVIIFGINIAAAISPKFRARLMARNVKAVKHMSEYSKDDLQEIQENFGEAHINAQTNIIDDNEAKLRNISDKSADINYHAIKSTSEAIASGVSEGLKSENVAYNTTKKVYCKHCGARIDADSVYCKECGQKQ